MIIREHYLQKIRPFVESDLIKIITGIRRCGKSVIMGQLEAELKAAGKRTMKFNFEDRAIFRSIRNADQLSAAVESQLTEEKLYVFLDEIQMVEDWNIACRSLRLKNLSLFVTSSNSKLLSKEFTHELSGRYVSFRVRPFVYRELVQYAAQLNHTYTVTDYLIFGGFPKVVEFDTKENRLQYLQDLDDTIVSKDIQSRYRVRQTELFLRLTDFVLMSNARIFSAGSIQKFLRNEHIGGSLTTIMKYLHYLEEAYITSPINQFSTRAKRALKYYQKIYDEDVAFNSIRQTGGRWDLTHNLENVVYNELCYRGFELSVYTDGEQEIDFLAEKEGKQYLIQVAYSIVEESTYRREFALFNKLDQSRKKIIITNDDVDFSTTTVTHLRLKDFLAGAEL